MKQYWFPFIKKLEGDLNHYEQEWIKKGFFADKTGFVGSGLEFEINLKFIAAYFGKDKAAECLTNDLSTLSPEERQYFIKALSGKSSTIILNRLFMVSIQMLKH